MSFDIIFSLGIRVLKFRFQKSYKTKNNHDKTLQKVHCDHFLPTSLEVIVKPLKVDEEPINVSEVLYMTIKYMGKNLQKYENEIVPIGHSFKRVEINVLGINNNISS